MDGGGRAGRSDYKNGIDSAALCGMGGEAIAVGKMAIVGGQCPAIGESDHAPLNCFNGDQLAVSQALCEPVSPQEELVAGAQRDLGAFTHFKGGPGAGVRKDARKMLGAILTAQAQAPGRESDDFELFILAKQPGALGKQDPLAGGAMERLTLLAGNADF